MAAGYVDIPAKDGAGTDITLRMWSTTGLSTGVLSPLALMADSSYALIDFTATSPVSIATAPALVTGTATIGAVAQVPRATANGATSSRINSAASNNLTSVKASAGQLYTIDVFNVAAYTVFLKLYNKASAPVVASDTPIWTIPIAAGTGYARDFPRGKAFATGIAYAIVKLQADTDATNVVAGDLTGSIDWI